MIGVERSKGFVGTRWCPVWLALMLPVGSVALAAQDIEMAGRVHGVKPPAAYYAAKAKDPHAFEFRRAWLRVGEDVRRTRADAAARMDLNRLNGGFAAGRAVPAAAVAQRLAVAGTRKIPVLLGMFSNSDSNAVVAIGDSVAYRAKLFGTNPAPPYSVTTYYDEISNGLLTMSGSTFGWFRANSSDTFYEGSPGCNGLGEGCGGHLGDYLKEILGKADGQVDFSQFDNDGPDGIPNSGDDDGFVDFVAFLMPEIGGECGTNNIWAHRYVLEGWSPGTGFSTNDPAAGGGTIQVSDYIIQSAVGGATGCTGGQIMPIGTMSHESGHAFGLPDLYDTFGNSEGTGEWSLMGSGSWNLQSAPAHMDAWSKFELGWIVVDTMTGGASPRPYVLNHIVHPASLIADTALALCTSAAACFTNEYFLLENRQAIGSDASVAGGGGLLAWHVDPAAISARLFSNTVNAQTPHGLALLEADGLDELDTQLGDRGDAGDPYPGSTANQLLDQTSNPSTLLNSGFPSGIVIANIAEQPDSTIAFEVHFEDVGTLPTQLALITPPSGAVSGQVPSQVPVVELRDGSNQPVLLAGIQVQVSVATGPGVIWANVGGKTKSGAARTTKIGGPQRSWGAGTVLTDANGHATFTDLVITDAGDYTLMFEVNGLPAVTSPTFTVTQPASTPLTNGVAVTGIAAQAGRASYFVLNVPAGLTSLDVTTTGSGDIDLLVRSGAPPTFIAANCFSFSFTATEACHISNPAAGNWYIMLSAFANSSNVTLTATASSYVNLAVITQPGGAVSGTLLTQAPVVELRDINNQPVLQSGVQVSAVLATGPGVLYGTPGTSPGEAKGGGGKKMWNRTGPSRVWGSGSTVTDASGRATFNTLSIIDAGAYTLAFLLGGVTQATSASFTVTQPASIALTNGQSVTVTDFAGRALYYSLNVPAGATDLSVSTTGGTGDVDLFLRLTNPPTTSAFDCLSESFTTEEQCDDPSPQGGTWQIMLIGYGDYADVTLTASFNLVTVDLTVAGAGTGTGTVTSAPAGIACTLTAGTASGTCTAPVVAAIPVTLTAAATSTSLFTLWTGAGACDHVAQCAVTLNQATGVTARFVLAPDEATGAGPLLSGAALTPEAATAIDQLGNKNGSYDLGDYLALIDHLATPIRFATTRPPLLRPASRAPHAPTKGDRP